MTSVGASNPRRGGNMSLLRPAMIVLVLQAANACVSQEARPAARDSDEAVHLSEIYMRGRLHPPGHGHADVLHGRSGAEQRARLHEQGPQKVRPKNNANRSGSVKNATATNGTWYDASNIPMICSARPPPRRRSRRGRTRTRTRRIWSARPAPCASASPATGSLQATSPPAAPPRGRSSKRPTRAAGRRCGVARGR